MECNQIFEVPDNKSQQTSLLSGVKESTGESVDSNQNKQEENICCGESTDFATYCIVCDKLICVPVLKGNDDILLVEHLCITLQFPSIVKWLDQMDLKYPNSQFCTNCSALIVTSMSFINQIQVLEKQLENTRNNIKQVIQDCFDEKFISQRPQLTSGTFIRKLFVQCWSDCKIDVTRLSKEAEEKIKDSQAGKSQDGSQNVIEQMTIEVYPEEVSDWGSLNQDNSDDSLHNEEKQDNKDFYYAFNRIRSNKKSKEIIDEGADSSAEVPVKRKKRMRKVKSKPKILPKTINRKPAGSKKQSVSKPPKTPKKVEKYFVCPQCGKGYIMKESYEAHLKRHLGELPYMCDYCDNTFASRKEKYVHRRQEHDISKTVGKDGVCPYCGLDFGILSKSNPTNEEKTSSTVDAEDLPGQAGVPDENSHNEGNLPGADPCLEGPLPVPDPCLEEKKRRKHIRHCLENPRVKFRNRFIAATIPCRLCSKVFTTSRTLQDHVASIHQKTFKLCCEICGVGFQLHSRLAKHLAEVHSDEKRYECEICHKKFKRQHQLIYHRRTHTGERPFVCELCGKSFVNPDGLTKHKHTHAEVNTFPCHICGKMFKSHGYRRYHITYTHQGRRAQNRAEQSDTSSLLLSAVEETNSLPRTEVIPTAFVYK